MNSSESFFPQPEADPLDALAPVGLALTFNGNRPELHDLTLGEADIADVRAMAGVSQPALPPQALDLWNTEAEKHLLGWGVMSMIPSSDLQSLMDWWADTVTLYGTRTEKDFRDFAERRFTRPQQDWLIGFYRSHLARR
jgi:hypothetical protein